MGRVRQLGLNGDDAGNANVYIGGIVNATNDFYDFDGNDQATRNERRSFVFIPMDPEWLGNVNWPIELRERRISELLNDLSSRGFMDRNADGDCSMTLEQAVALRELWLQGVNRILDRQDANEV